MVCVSFLFAQGWFFWNVPSGWTPLRFAEKLHLPLGGGVGVGYVGL